MLFDIASINFKFENEKYKRNGVKTNHLIVYLNERRDLGKT